MMTRNQLRTKSRRKKMSKNRQIQRIIRMMRRLSQVRTKPMIRTTHQLPRIMKKLQMCNHNLLTKRITRTMVRFQLMLAPIPTTKRISLRTIIMTSLSQILR